MTAVKKRELVDELGALDIGAPARAEADRRSSEIRAAIRLWYPRLAAEKTITETGNKYIATVGAQENCTVITSMTEVANTMGFEQFTEAATVTLKKLKELLPKHYEHLTSTDRTGTRKIQTFPRK